MLLCIKSSLNASGIELENNYPEQVWCKLTYNGNRELLVGVCYRMPSKQVYSYKAYQELRHLMKEVSNREFLLTGDFNYKGIDWETSCVNNGASTEGRLFLECINEYFMSQHVNFLTMDKSVLDLVLSRDPDVVSNVQVFRSFESSDHRLLGFNLNIVKDEEVNNSTRYDYKRMDIKGAREELRKINWEEMLSGTVNDDRERLKDTLFEIQQKFFPVVKGKRKNKKLWLTYKALLKTNTKSSENIRIVVIRHVRECQSRLVERLKRLSIILKENWQRILRVTPNLFLLMFRVGQMLQRSWDHW